MFCAQPALQERNLLRCLLHRRRTGALFSEEGVELAFRGNKVCAKFSCPLTMLRH